MLILKHMRRWIIMNRHPHSNRVMWKVNTEWFQYLHHLSATNFVCQSLHCLFKRSVTGLHTHIFSLYCLSTDVSTQCFIYQWCPYNFMRLRCDLILELLHEHFIVRFYHRACIPLMVTDITFASRFLLTQIIPFLNMFVLILVKMYVRCSRNKSACVQCVQMTNFIV